MRVLLLSPPFKADYMRNARCDFISLSHTQWYPILLGYAGALLEKNSHQVSLVDAPSANLSIEQVEKIARDFHPDLLVVYGGRLSEENDQKIADYLTDILDCQTVFCGPFVSISPQRWLENSKLVPFAVKGEFEYPLLEIAEEADPSSIKNLLYKQGDEIVENKIRPYLNRQQLDAIPFVSQFFKRHLNIRNYRTIEEPFPFIDIMTGRGCNWGICSFCLWVHSYVQGPVYNNRSPENVLEEIEYIMNFLPEVKSIMFQDDNFPDERAREIAEGILRNGWKVTWSCYSRADLSRETMELMAKAGCLNVNVGFESATDAILKRAGKGLSVERMTRFVREAKESGLHIHGDFLMGLEGETPDSLLKIAHWAASLNVDTAQFQVLIPFEGTPLNRSLSEKGWIKDGYPNYPNLSAEEIHRIARKAYRIFYLRPQQLFDILAHPKRRLWHYLKVAHRIIPNIFWVDQFNTGK